jgi:hypothetical protein
MPRKPKSELALIIERCAMKQSAHLDSGSGNGIVNVYPVTCIPVDTTSVMVKSLVSERGMAYPVTTYDSRVEPGRVAAMRRRRRGMTEEFAL